MSVMRRLGSFIRALAAGAGAMGADGASAQAIALDSLFGIRMGTLLEAQLSECPKNTTREGVIVEISVSAYHDHWRDMQRYLVRTYGKPHETKTYKNDSRVFGFSTSRTFTWRANGIALYLNPRQRGDHASIRMVSLAWEAINAKEEEEHREARMRRGNM